MRTIAVKRQTFSIKQYQVAIMAAAAAAAADAATDPGNVCCSWLVLAAHRRPGSCGCGSNCSSASGVGCSCLRFSRIIYMVKGLQARAAGIAATVPDQAVCSRSLLYMGWAILLLLDAAA